MTELIQKLMAFGMEYFGLYYGVYRAKVIRNDDPNNCGRLVVNCPQVHGTTTADIWAFPKAPFGGSQNGLWVIPDVGDWVYVTFDHGRPEYPIWEGGWWGTGDPTTDMTVKSVVLATKEGMKIVIDRTAKTVLVQQSPDNSILITENETTFSASTKMNLVCSDIELEGDVTITGNVDITGDVAMTGDGTVSGSWIATTSDGHHSHPLGPNPLPPHTTIALPQVP